MMPRQSDEGRRQAYLAALGIPLWTARYALPGALPSRELLVVPYRQEAPDAVMEPPDAVLLEVAPVIAKASVSRPLPDRATTKPAVTVPPQSVVSEAFPRFACRVQLLAPGWLGVIALEEAPDLSALEYRLLDNLIQALGGDVATPSVREQFQWPLLSNPGLPRDAAAALEALSVFLGRRHEATRWLVLGETLAVYVRAALSQHAVVAAPTLRELLAQPARKRALWQALYG